MKAYCVCERCGYFIEVDTSSVSTIYYYHCPYCDKNGHVLNNELIYDVAINDVTAITTTISTMSEAIGVPCLICGEAVPAKTMHSYEAAICKKCKKAVLKMREVSDNE